MGPFYPREGATPVAVFGEGATPVAVFGDGLHRLWER